MGNKGKRRKLVGVVFLTIVVGLILLTLGSLFLKMNSDKKASEGFLSQTLEYKNRNMMKTTFGSIEEFDCFASCYCGSLDSNGNDMGRRRQGTTVVQKGLFLSVAVTTAALAFKMAENVFQEECLKFADSCDDGNVQTNVEFCEKSKGKTTEAETDSDMERYFDCTGNCISNPDFDRKAAVDKGMDAALLKRWDCEVFDLKQNVIVDESQLKKGFYNKIFGFMKRKLGILATAKDEAMMNMRYRFLTPFCNRIKIPDQKVEMDTHICMAETQVEHVDRSKIKCVERK